MFINQIASNIFLYLISCLGLVLNRRNILITIMCIELLLLSLNLNFTIFSIYLDDLYGQFFSLIILTIAAAESAVGLAIIINFYRLRGSIQMNQSTIIKS